MMKHSFLTSMLLLLLASCTTESRYDEPNQPDTPDNTHDAGRREVLLTLNNKLSLHPSGRAIATTEENVISSLDVYVFGSTEENGTYTYQQRFSYRSDEALAATSTAPWEGAAAEAAGIEELQLSESADGDRNTTTGLLSLKRGLFVKLYCIANDTLPVNPVTGKAMKAKDFIPIKFNNTDGKTSIASVGVPMEQDFLKFRTALLEGGKVADAKGEVLLTPLAMSGAMTTPLDLTDPTNSSRLQTRLRLTRLAARFDIVNDAQTSRFTIRSVSMGNARRGASFFPITVQGDTPAKDGELVTLTPRTFSNKTGTAGGTSAGVPNANQGLSTGAFYSYPSPQADGGYLILKGLYQINQTEQKEVTYQVPFRQSNAPGTSETYLDINNNHRYTLAITRADDYHLDFTMKVADWTDDGSIDDYQPENKPGELTVKIPDTFAGDTQDTFDKTRRIHTVSMSLKDGSTFDAFVGTTSPLTVSKTYAGGVAGQKYDWLEISEPLITRLAASTYQYTFSLKPGYILGRYPRVTVRIFDSLSGEETILYVEAIAVPQPAEIQQPEKAPNGSSRNPNTFDVNTQTATIYRINNSRASVRITCPDGAVLKSNPDWVNVTEESHSGADIIYAVTLNERDTKETSGTVVFANEKHPELATDINIVLEDASVVSSFTGVGTENSYTPPATPDEPGKVTMKIADGNTCVVNTTSMDGVAVKIEYPEGSPQWLAYEGGETMPASKSPDTGTTANKTVANARIDADKIPAHAGKSAISPRAGDRQNSITFRLVNDKLAGAKPATVTLVNRIGGPDYRFTIAPQLQKGSMEKISSVPVDDTLGADNTLTLYKLPEKASTMEVKVTSYGGSVLTSDNDCVTVTKSTVSRNSSVTQDENIAYYTLTATAPGTATLTLANRTDTSKTETFAVTVISSEITVPATMSVNTSAVGQTATAKASSPLGFTAEVTDFTNSEGGQSWLRIDSKDVAGGKDANFTVAVNALPATLRPTTVTLKNKIKDGGDKVITISPTYVVPAASATTRNYNTLTGSTNTATLKLYRYAGSYLAVNVRSVGGSMIQNASGVTVTNAAGSYNTDNTYTITLASATTQSGSFQIVNKSDASKVTTVTVTAPATVNTAPANKNLTAASGQYVDNLNVNFPEGFTASVTGWGSGGTANWFKLNNTNFNSGNQTVRCTMNTTNGMTMKPATVTLKNKIAGGQDKTFIVTPVFVAPTAANGGTQVPSQNKTLSGNAIKLYRVANSKVYLKVSALGGTYLKSGVSGISVSGGNNTNTDNTYTVTWSSGTASGNLVFAHKQDANKTLSINVASLNPAITAGNVSVTAANSGSTNLGGITSPEGCTASIVNGWNGGGDWVYISNANVAAGTNKTFTITQRNNVNTVMKPITIRLTNKIAGGPNKDIMLTPNLSAPTLTAAVTDIGQPVNVNNNFNGTLTVTAPAGGWEYVSNSNNAVATVSASGTTYTIKPLTKGSTTLTFRNRSDYNKTSTKTFTVVAPTYNGTAVYKTNQAGVYYIAMQDAGFSKWNTSLNANYCANKTGGNWHVPNDSEWRQILGTSEDGKATAAVYNEYKNAGVFVVNGYYWATTVYTSYSYCLYFLESGSAYVKYYGRTNTIAVRCVAR